MPARASGAPGGLSAQIVANPKRQLTVCVKIADVLLRSSALAEYTAVSEPGPGQPSAALCRKEPLRELTLFRRAARLNRRRTSLTVLRTPRSFAVISRSQGSHFALPRLSMNLVPAGMPPQFRTSPSIRSLQVPSTPRFSIPLLSAFYPLQRLPVLLSSCTNSCKLLQVLRKALPSLFLRTSLLGGNTIRLVVPL